MRMLVAQLTLKDKDSAGAIVDIVYAKRQPLYAVYGAEGRVIVHYADDVEQRCRARSLLDAQVCTMPEHGI